MSHVPDLHAFLAALGIRTSRPRLIGALIIGVFEVSFIGICLLQAFVEWRSGVSPLLVVVVVWMVWTYWHSVLFPRRRLRYVQSEALPYRAAFIRDIYPWVTLGFSQMWRPLFNGDVVADVLDLLRQGPIAIPWLRFAVGAILATIALAVMIDAIRTIGFSNASFVSEFVATDTFHPIERGVYARLRHPLFAAGALYSVALAVAVFTPTAFGIAAMNCIYVGVYSRLEDHRMRRVFGTAYVAYERAVPALTVNFWSRESGAARATSLSAAPGSAGADRRHEEVARAASIERKEEKERSGQEVAPPDRGKTES